MGHFMPEDCGEHCFSFRHGEDARVHRDLATRKGEGIDRLVVFDDSDVPGKPVGCVGVFRLLGRLDDASRHTLDWLGFFGIV